MGGGVRALVGGADRNELRVEGGVGVEGALGWDWGLQGGRGIRLGQEVGSEVQASGSTYVKQLPEEVACPHSSSNIEVQSGGSTGTTPWPWFPANGSCRGRAEPPLLLTLLASWSTRAGQTPASAPQQELEA